MRKIFFLSVSAVFFTACNNQSDEPKIAAAQEAAATQQASEFADARYADVGKTMMKNFADGNYDAWGEAMAENVVYQYSAGDSMAGKKAVLDYWKDRRAKLIQSVNIANDIWLPIKVNVPQKGPDMPGVWLLNWNQVTATYKNGKSLQFWAHQGMHFDAQDKVDRIVMYMDRAPINAALAAK